MNRLIKLILVVFLLGTLSCRDSKKEEAEQEAMIEKIDSIEQEATSLTEMVEKDANELEEALNELDSI